jgi:hypothetical protein
VYIRLVQAPGEWAGFKGSMHILVCESLRQPDLAAMTQTFTSWFPC